MGDDYRVPRSRFLDHFRYLRSIYRMQSNREKASLQHNACRAVEIEGLGFRVRARSRSHSS